MISESITAVLLPAGPGTSTGTGTGTSAKPRARIYLTPRLGGAHRLSAFPDWLHWTRLVHDHGLRFDLACGGRTATVAADTAPLRPDVWDAIFGHDSLVAPYPKDDFDQRLVVSYPSRDAAAYLQWAYGVASTSLLVKDRLMSEILGDLVFRGEGGDSTLDDTLSRLRVAMWQAQQDEASTGDTGAPPTTATTPSSPGQKPPGVRAMAERFALYHHLPPAPGRPPLPSHPHELEHLVDFHQALAALAGYPALLAAAGLALTVELPGNLCPASPAAGAYLEVSVTGITPGFTWTHAPTIDGRTTAYVRSAGRFAAAPATAPGAIAAGTIDPGDIVDGFLALTADDFQLVGVDLDGAILKAMALADSLANAPDPALADGLLPALRSSGLSLLADGRAQELLRAIRDNHAFADGTSTRALDARDLTRGYRLDVLSDTDTGPAPVWRSLHRRDGTYRLGANGATVVDTIDEEGFTQLAVVQPAPDPTRPQDPVATSAGAPQPGTDLYLNERVARWNGWSLSAPRPGTPLNRTPDPASATDPDPTAGQPATTFKLTSSFAVHPGSLPSLRFGRRYRVRARAVDLAGDSVPLTALVPDHLAAPAGGLLPYLRYEPVPPPLVVLRALPGPGASLHHLVIRSHNADPALDTVPSGDGDERHIAPPRAAEQLVEHHGMLDDAAGLRGDAATYAFLTGRDRGEPPTSGNDPLEPAAQLDVTWLPDPLARGAALSSLPQTEPASSGAVTGGALAYAAAPGAHPRPQSVTKLPFGSPWPQRQAFRLRLAEGDGPPTWDDAARVLTVALPKAVTTTTALSSFTDPTDLDLLGVWNWMLALFEAADAAALQDPGAGSELVRLAANRTALTQQALDAANEFLTPSHTLTLTHAVQQPLGHPAFTRLPIVHRPGDPVAAVTLANAFSPITAWRSLGSHHAVLLGALAINGASTSDIDLEARWNEWVDDVDAPAPVRRRASGHVERIRLASLTGGALPADGTGDRQVAVYVPEIDVLWFAAPFDELDGVDTPPVVAAPIHQLGDTKHRVVRYRATASSRFQEYLAEPGTDCTRTGPPLIVDVPSSARPLAPDVAYVVPVFGWDREVSTDTRTEVRSGNALRVYLRRPWFSSGNGEQLGVVLWPAAQGDPDDDQREASKGVFTQWGLDPAWDPGTLPPVPGISDFPRSVRQASGLTLQEPGLLVDVAGHRVGFDAARRLWYCDVELRNPGAYAPFVRLALARYQPRSIAGVELSNVTLADFAQLTPSRSAALTLDPSSPRQARVVVGGLAPDGPTRAVFSVDVETRLEHVHSDLGWAPATPAQAQVLVDSPTEPESALFSATITFAHAPSPGAFRLVVREYEVIEVDPPDTALSDTPELGQRLVYAAILPLPPAFGPANP